jgi:hypothetical protein
MERRRRAFVRDVTGIFVDDDEDEAYIAAVAAATKSPPSPPPGCDVSAFASAPRRRRDVLHRVANGSSVRVFVADADKGRGESSALVAALSLRKRGVFNEHAKSKEKAGVASRQPRVKDRRGAGARRENNDAAADANLRWQLSRALM